MSATPYTLAVKVKADTTVTVAAGAFEAYEVEVSGPRGVQRIFVRKAAPHLALRQEFGAQPVALELKEIR